MADPARYDAAAGCDGTLTGTGGVPSAASAADGHDGDHAVLNRSRTRTRAAGALLRIVDRRALSGGENELVVGLRLVDHVPASVNVWNVTNAEYLNSLEWGQAYYAAPRSTVGTMRVDY